MAHPLTETFRLQARACLPGSPLSAALLTSAADDLEAGGPTAEVMAPFVGDDRRLVPALRLLGALHRRVLLRAAPELALHYPSVGGTAPVREAWPAARRLLAAEPEQIRADAGRPVQTNEVGRSAALYGALLVLADRHRLPVHLLEIWASGGLNLNADRYAYNVGRTVLGDRGSEVTLNTPWRGYPQVDLTTPVEIVERAGCDPRPVDVGSTEGRLTLTSYVWADWTERLERLRGAFAVADRHPVRVEAMPTATWLALRLGWPRRGRLTLVWHSLVWQYLALPEQLEVERVLREAAGRATDRAPLAVLGLEHVADSRFELRLRTWPGGQEELLATTTGHGVPVAWRRADQTGPQPAGRSFPVIERA